MTRWDVIDMVTRFFVVFGVLLTAIVLFVALVER